jgi:hypothetical protein
LVACGPEAPEKTEALPDWIIPEEKMVDVLTDVHIIEGARIGQSVLGDSLPAKFHYQKVWEKYNINAALYDSSFRYYSRNAERMDLMYEEVLTRLTKMSSELEANPNKKEEEEEED